MPRMLELSEKSRLGKEVVVRRRRRYRQQMGRGRHWRNRQRSRRTSYGRVLYNYYRTYDPSTGRYLESDPIGLIAGLNTYSYVGNMPTMRVDPFGLFEVICEATPAQRRLLEELGEQFERGLADVCTDTRKEMQEIYDELQVFVDPRMQTDRLWEPAESATAYYNERQIEFHAKFFKSGPYQQALTFTHEFRHLMEANHALIRPGELVDRVISDPERYRKLPAEIDSDSFAKTYNADACMCEIQ